jgi:hypothetical protein
LPGMKHTGCKCDAGGVAAGSCWLVPRAAVGLGAAQFDRKRTVPADSESAYSTCWA